MNNNTYSVSSVQTGVRLTQLAIYKTRDTQIHTYHTSASYLFTVIYVISVNKTIMMAIRIHDLELSLNQCFYIFLCILFEYYTSIVTL